MNIKKLREEIKVDIAFEQHWLDEAEAILQKDYCQDPAKQKYFARVRRLKRILQEDIKFHEKELEQLSKRG